MHKVILAIIMAIIIVFTVAGYFFIAQFSNPHPATTQTPTAMISPSQTTYCQKSQLSAAITAQGAAGNIYATLVMTNIGKISCEVVLGDSVSAVYAAKNIVVNYKQNVPSRTIMLAPNAKVYSQIHYPNGPQCQNGIVPQPIAFYYKTDKQSVLFQPNPQTGKLIVQACQSESEKTLVDIWPLSKNPITP